MSSLTRFLPLSRQQAGRTTHRRIVASFGRMIQVIDLASGTQTTITTGQVGTFTEPEWMPGSSALVFGPNQAGSWDVYSGYCQVNPNSFIFKAKLIRAKTKNQQHSYHRAQRNRHEIT